MRITRKKILAAGIAVGLFGIATVTAVAVGHKVHKKADQALAMVQTVDKVEVKEMENENISEETIMQLKDHWTVAAFGLDSRDSDNLKNGNSDVIILMDMNGKTGAVKLVSVYRDTCLDIGNQKYRKANAAYANGGPKQAVKMLNENLDMEIDDYVAVTWKSVADAINILGGVDLEVTKSEFRYINAFITETVKSTGIGSHQLKSAGMQHLDGVQAVAYCRLRLMDNDFKRTERQQKVLKLALEKAKKADMATLNNIIVTVFPQTASSIETDDLIAVMKNIFKLHISDTTGFPAEYVCERAGGADYVFPKDLSKNVTELHHFLYGTEEYEPSPYVQTVSEGIERKRKGSANTGTGARSSAESESNELNRKDQETEPESGSQESYDALPEETSQPSESGEWRPETLPSDPESTQEPQESGDDGETEVESEPQTRNTPDGPATDDGGWEWDGDTLRYSY